LTEALAAAQAATAAAEAARAEAAAAAAATAAGHDTSSSSTSTDKGPVQQLAAVAAAEAAAAAAAAARDEAEAIAAALSGMVWTRSMKRLYTLVDRWACCCCCCCCCSDCHMCMDAYEWLLLFAPLLIPPALMLPQRQEFQMGRTAQPGEDSLTALGPAAQWVFSDSSFPTPHNSHIPYWLSGAFCHM
jgi:multidrug efflux pump subunit AcrA (membrane-fusion protein)